MSIFSRDPLQILIFKTYGTQNHLYIKGRALEDENINLNKTSFWSILKNSWKRFESDEIKNAELTIELSDGTKIETKTDNDGYFLIDKTIAITPDLIINKEWLPIQARYTQTNFKNKINNNNNNKFIGELLIPNKNAEYGIISDIDDTILHTGVVSKLKWKLLLNTFFIAPQKRKALNGASDFYHLLAKGTSSEIINPIFYVSHSPWNMYPYLEHFLSKNNFPKGAILLRTAKAIFTSKKDEKSAKQQEIENILKTYKSINFMLIGDAGELDADIYMDIAKHFPNRIKAIFLRSVDSKKRMTRIKNLTKNYTDVPFFIVNSSKEATKIAKENNFIS